ncbi:50S ribosomal protein L25/general stress protein Ctc [Leucobacter sp. UCMA 4100]|uniref:50S ribosomal protein L25/general stress protein Ctc n=1 Tax=Leucobacter sp. UCMA 4100 TaxID=2810534 RepID=UPI0022EA1417|nr:50S ribosomal protein L25/general stress protein Ctc [Leucobacter sp. UCMA 4100]MDA3147824.1 50S ribosomal protein L25/general stress protein Ctc [Leucobacter sp. UCMA 4100]
MSADVFKLEAAPRENFGKGAARKLRALGQTPAVVYGHGAEPLHISVDAHALSLIVRYANSVIELDIDGKKQLVLVKDVQKEAVRHYVEHVDLLIIKKGETVEVEVPVTVVGEPFNGATMLLELNTLALNVPATSIPEVIEIDVEGLEAGTRFLVQDIKLPAGASAVDDAEALVVNIVEARVSEEPEAAAEEAPAEAAE